METFFTAYKSELFWSLITISTIVIVRFIALKAIKRTGRISNFVIARTLLVTKYVSVSLTILGFSVLIFIWGVNVRDIGLMFSSVFTIMGVALFAQWSILSNVTSGVILFFSFPFKIGDHVRILDKEIVDVEIEGNNVYLIEDIKAFHLLLRRKSGELLTYPNNMMLQKAVALVEQEETIKQETDID